MLSFLWCCSNVQEDGTYEEPESSDFVQSGGILASSSKLKKDEDSPTSVGSTVAEDASPTDTEESAAVPEPAVVKEEAAPRRPSVNSQFASGTFDIRLEMRVGERLGALLDILDLKTLRVVHIREEGRLRKHNNENPARKQVHEGCFIVSVNGKSGDVEVMVDELQRTRIWRMTVARLYKYSAALRKTGPLCLDLHFEPEGNCVVIRRIGEGMVKAYNEDLPEGAEAIKVGDRIYSVNGQSLTATQMLNEIRDARDELSLELGRPQMW